MSIKDWILEKYTLEQIKDTAEDGCATGIKYLMYNTVTAKFHDAFEKEIWGRLCQQSEDFGCDSVPAFISQFGGSQYVRSMEHFKNLLAWWAAEHFAQEIMSDVEEDENGELVHDGVSSTRIQIREKKR
jgi:hypothetical protein